VAGNEQVESVNAALGRLDDEIAVLHFAEDQYGTPLEKTGRVAGKLVQATEFFALCAN
jgi:hypothetical protein